MHEKMTQEQINEYKKFLLDIYGKEFCFVDEPTPTRSTYMFSLYSKDGSAITKYASPYSLTHFNKYQEKLF